MTTSDRAARQRGVPLSRTVVQEPLEEAVLRVLAGKVLYVREEHADLVAAIRWLHEHGYDKARIVAELLPLTSLRQLLIRGDGWQVLADVSHGRWFWITTLAEKDLR